MERIASDTRTAKPAPLPFAEAAIFQATAMSALEGPTARIAAAVAAFVKEAATFLAADIAIILAEMPRAVAEMTLAEQSVAKAGSLAFAEQ